MYNEASELNQNSGWYETFFRGYDPTLGRFHQVDPLAHASSLHTPYNYAYPTRSSRVYEDLKIDGDDAFELIQAFIGKFNVDMNGFKYNEYFAPEGIDLPGVLARLFKNRNMKLKPLTLADLERAAKLGKWVG